MTHNGTTRTSLVAKLALCVLGLLGTLSYAPSPAWACETLCARFLPDRGTMIPSNTPALVFLSSSTVGGATDIRLTRIDGGRSEAVDIRIEPQKELVEDAQQFALIRFDPLVEGASYSLVHDVKDSSKCHAQAITFEVGPKAALPTKLGELSATPSRCEMIATPCVASYWGARSDLALTVDEQIYPWRYLLLYRSVIERAAREYRSDVGLNPPEGRLQVPCNEAGEGTDSQTYEAYLEGWIPGLTDTLKTAALSVELKCEKKPVEQSAAPAAGAGAAGAAPSAFQSAPMRPAADGCSIARARASRHPYAAWALVACLVGLRARRRDSDSRPCR